MTAACRLLSIGAALVNNENVIRTQFHQTDNTVLDAASHILTASLDLLFNVLLIVMIIQPKDSLYSYNHLATFLIQNRWFGYKTERIKIFMHRPTQRRIVKRYNGVVNSSQFWFIR